jgi:D-beta-D-heptose 7-phosphate kinase/D-beta-D-heptose 1-phosphate adenosyltransferase
MRVWVNGTFDVLHIGHVRLLEFAKTFGEVRVGVDTDQRVKERKGESRPYNSLDDRIDFLKSLKSVDSVVSFDSNDELCKRIQEWKPDLMVIGDDYELNSIVGIEHIPRVEFFRKIPGHSTSKILKATT